MPAVTLAGALALAGCGGGSSTPGAVVSDTSNADTSNADTSNADTSATEKTAALPGVSRLETDEASLTFTIQPGLANSGRVQSIWFTCTGSEACVVTVPAGSSVSTVSYTGGTLVAAASDPRAISGTTARSGADTDPLSHENLLAAVLANGRIFGVSAGTTGVRGAEGVSTSNTFERADDHTTILNMAMHGVTETTTAATGDYVYYGYDWTKPTTSAGYTRTLRWGGSIEHSTPPVEGTATYEGTAVIYGKEATGGWQHAFNDPAVVLTADFAEGEIYGNVGATQFESGTDVNNSRIDLGSTKIGSDGTFSGNAKFTVNAGTALTAATGAGKGDWNGRFFGPGLAETGSDTDIFESAVPTHAAGQFSVSRTGASALTLHGAFGGDR